MLPVTCQYVRNLRSSQRFFTLQSKSAFVVADCDAAGNLKPGYCLLQKIHYHTTGGDSIYLLKCSCTMAKQQRARLDAFPPILLADVAAMVSQETGEYCVHANAVDILRKGEESDEDDGEDQADLTVDFLSLEPPLVAVFDGGAFGLVGFKRTTKLQCLLCDHKCQHVQLFGDWCKANDVHLDKDDPLKEEPIFNSVSSLPIPYPLPTHLKSLHDQHERGSHEFPLQLVPHYTSTCKCEHGNPFSSADPVQNGWIVTKGCIVHKEAVTIEDKNRTIFYRPSVGSCSCKQAYDGQDDLLFNLDNKHLFYYGYLFQYLHLMLEGKNPLIAFLRASTRSFSSLSLTKSVSLKLLRQAWNAFARLLDIDFAESFACPICGASPSTIICDGTLLGFRKDLLDTLTTTSPTPQAQQPVKGSSHSRRVLITIRICTA